MSGRSKGSRAKASRKSIVAESIHAAGAMVAGAVLGCATKGLLPRAKPTKTYASIVLLLPKYTCSALSTAVVESRDFKVYSIQV